MKKLVSELRSEGIRGICWHVLRDIKKFKPSLSIPTLIIHFELNIFKKKRIPFLGYSEQQQQKSTNNSLIPLLPFYVSKWLVSSFPGTISNSFHSYFLPYCPLTYCQEMTSPPPLQRKLKPSKENSFSILPLITNLSASETHSLILLS